MPQKKAISPIIAIIIILLITIAIAGAGLVGKEIQVVSSFCTGDNQGKIMVKNIGNNPVRTGEITIINPNTGEDITQDILWSSQVSDPGLVLELRFEEGSGTTAKDTSGNGNDGTLYGDTAWAEGRVGKGFEFDGNGDYVDCGNDESLNITNQDFSLSVWIKTTDSGSNKIIISKYGLPGWELFADSGGARIFLYENATAKRSVNGGTIDDGGWHHVVGATDFDDYTRLYVDGQEVGTPDKTAYTTLYASQNVQIGRRSDGSNFNGIIDEVRIYNRALSPEEIKALYENSILLQPGESATLTHTCAGVCRYNLVLGWGAKEAMVQC